MENLHIGWDVGGWNCDKNPKSRDAIVILDKNRQVLGIPWRGNLRNTINGANSSAEWISAILALCQVNWSDEHLPKVTMAIDTPLGFSDEFRQLLNGVASLDTATESTANRYLFRHTERFLSEHGLTPLSAIKDMIGSQATKGMHVLSKLSLKPSSPGIWADNHLLKAIEAYPAACKHSPTVGEILTPFMSSQDVIRLPMDSIWEGATFTSGIDHDDKRDALICALVAWLFDWQKSSLAFPLSNTPVAEGWIFIPEDALEQGGQL